jgi:uncharacterized membrane protein (UPF0127 family)
LAGIPTVKIRSGKRVLFDRVKVCADFFSKGMGIMGRKEPLSVRECLLFVEARELPPAIMAIHMSFCNFPIKVAWLDRNGKVVDVQLARPTELFRLRSWKLYAPKGNSRYIVECAPSAGLRKGMTLDFPDS